MANLPATTVSNRDLFVAGNKRVVTGTLTNVDTAAAGEDTCFPGLTRVTAVTASFASTAVTSVHAGPIVFPSTVNTSGFVIRSVTTHNNFPVVFRAEGI